MSQKLHEASVVKLLFLGKILEENLVPFPKIRSEEGETLTMMIDSVGKFLKENEKRTKEFDEAGAQSEEFIGALKELGLFGLLIGEEFGGLGLSNTGYSRMLQEISKYDAATSITVGAHSSIGMKGLLLFGNDEQKKRYLPKLASGEMIAAFCLTEPGAGSDAASIKTHATRQSDGSWILNGEKLWISNGAFAEFFTVFARTEGEEGKISAFIVERSFGGVTNGPKEDKLGIRASATTTVNFENVRVPAENLLGEAGKGFKIAMAILNNGRTGLGGGAVGAMKRCIDLAVRQASERKQFGKNIGEFALVKKKIAQMTINCFAAESAVSMVAHYIDSGLEDYSVEAAISKIYASEALWFAAYEALQIAGGNGFMKEYPYEKIMRDSRINTIFEGTNEILRLYVALSGLKEAGEYLKGVEKGVSSLLTDPIKGFGVLSAYASKKISQYTAIGRDRFEGVAPELEESARTLEYYSLWFGRATESVLRRYGKSIVGRQLLSERLANVAIDLFVGLCTISRVTAMIQERGAAQCEDELTIVRLFVAQAKRRMNQSLRHVESPDDPLIEKLSDSIVQKEGYRWDTF